MDKEFLNDIYQMRQAQRDCDQSRKNFSALQKARIYERRVDAELAKRIEILTNK